MIKDKIHLIGIVLFIILPIILFSCKNETRFTNKSSAFVANLDSVKESEFKYSDLYGKVTAIVLDNKEVLLNEISKMLVFKDKLYLLDRSSQGIYAFRKDGSFVRKFGNIGAAPDEYVSCNDFAINTDAGEVYVYDTYKNMIHKYDVHSGSYKGNIHIEKGVEIDYIAYNSGYLYAAQTNDRNEGGKKPYYLLHQIDIESGEQIAEWLDAKSYNKGWNDEFFHGNIFYRIRENEDLFVLGLMDSIMCIKEGKVQSFLAVESERFVREEDILEEEKVATSDPVVQGRRMMSMQQRFATQGKYHQIYNVFAHNDIVYFSCMGGVYSYLVQYDRKKQTTSIHSRMRNDVLYQVIPNHSQIPAFLCTDETGGYYCVPNENQAQLKHFAEEGNISEKMINREGIEKLDEDSNPLILYYEYKD